MESFDKLQKLIESFQGKVCTETEVNDAVLLLNSIKGYAKVLDEGIVRYVDVNDLVSKWKEVGCGEFGKVYSSRYGGSKVAIKILFNNVPKSKIREGKILYSLSHENIIAFRGIGYISDQKVKDLKLTITQEHSGEMMFLVMEFIDQNLLKYVDSMIVNERKGLRYDMVWNIGQQIASALNYLHGLDITHRDLKPDNILLEVGPRRIVVKLADFGLADDANQINTNPPHDKTTSSSQTAPGVIANIRWGAPEMFSDGHCWTLDKIKAADMYCFGNVLAFTLTGQRPHEKTTSDSIGDNLEKDVFIPDLPKSLKGCLNDAVSYCRQEKQENRPTAAAALKTYFSFERNPYLLKEDPEKEVEFFTCGFMDKTDIFVADSCTDKQASQTGFYQSKIRPTGYDHKNLKCQIEVEDAPYRDKPDNLETEYYSNVDEFQKLEKAKVIDNNPTVALKGLKVTRPAAGDEECQIIEFTFKQSDYIHHRAMRKIWIEYSNEQKVEALPSKAEVHPYFSNTFGLHVAVLTNEGPDKPQKFLFPRRAQRAGMAAPGKYTCGAVESASKPDYIQEKDGEMSVDLVNTAARGLQEELGLELTGNDLKAICLTTVYLKFDTHEWGLCGFVDLKDERIKPEHRISADSLKDIFSTGPKDKFEHQNLTFIDFDLNTMVDFVFNNHENFASSAKLVVVKVLQAFYGWQRVQQEFEMRLFGE